VILGFWIFLRNAISYLSTSKKKVQAMHGN
jgi:hypothetical protein